MRAGREEAEREGGNLGRGNKVTEESFVLPLSSLLAIMMAVRAKGANAILLFLPLLKLWLAGQVNDFFEVDAAFFLVSFFFLSPPPSLLPSSLLCWSILKRSLIFCPYEEDMSGN